MLKWDYHTPSHSQEVQSTGCNATGDAARPYVCPGGGLTPNPGLLAGAERTVFEGMDQVNSE